MLGKLKEADLELRSWRRSLTTSMLQVPNFMSLRYAGRSKDKDNVEVRRYGQQPSFAFEPRSHVELGVGLACSIWKRSEDRRLQAVCAEG